MDEPLTQPPAEEEGDEQAAIPVEPVTEDELEDAPDLDEADEEDDEE